MAERSPATESYAGFTLVERMPASAPDVVRWRAEGREGVAEVFLGDADLLARARALPTGGPFPDVRSGERDGRAWVAVPGELAVDLAALQRRLGEGGLAFGWHIAAALGELHEQGGAHGRLHPAYVGLDSDGYLVIRPALAEAIAADPDPHAPAQATDCRLLADLLAALAPTETGEGPLALLLAGLRQDRARLRVQPGWAARQTLAVVLGRDPEREERLKAELGEGWALEQPFWPLMARHQPQPPIRPLAEESEAYGRWVAGDSAVVQRPVAEALLTAAIRRQTPVAAPEDWTPAAPAVPAIALAPPEEPDEAARLGPARVILPFNRDDLIATLDAEEGEEDTGAQEPIELPFPERQRAARVQLPGPRRDAIPEISEDSGSSSFLTEEIPADAFSAFSPESLAFPEGAEPLPAPEADFGEEATVVGPAPDLALPVADPAALDFAAELVLPPPFSAPIPDPADEPAPSLPGVLRFPATAPSDPAAEADDPEETPLSGKGASSTEITLVDERLEDAGEDLDDGEDFAGEDIPTGVFAVLDDQDDEPSEAFAIGTGPAELLQPTDDPPPLRLVPPETTVFSTAVVSTAVVSTAVVSTAAPPDAVLPLLPAPLALATPADLDEPTIVSSAVAAGREEPKWAGVRGVTGGSSRESELGSGKWTTEPSHTAEDIARALPASPPRAMDLGKDRPSWPIYVAAVALIAAVVLGLLYRGPFAADAPAPVPLAQPLAAAPASTVQVDVASGPAGQVRFDGRDYGRTPAGIPLPADDAPRTLCVEQPQATTCLPVTRAELAAQGSVYVFDPTRAAPPP